jgi:hypothetical protein
MMNFNKKIKLLLNNIKLKTSNMIIGIISVIIILVTVAIGLLYFIPSFGLERRIEISGRVDIQAEVFYLENDTFPANPIPRDLYYLMSFTDYIQVSNRLLLDLNKEVEVYYSYTSSKRLIIRHMATGDSNLNPIVFRESVSLSEIQGNMTTSSLRFPNENSNNGGITDLGICIRFIQGNLSIFT